MKFPHLAELRLPAPRRASCSATTNFVHVHIHFKLNMSPIFILITWAPPLPLRLPLRLLLWVLLKQVHWCQKLYFAQLFQPMPKTQVPLDYKYAEFFQSLFQGFWTVLVEWNQRGHNVQPCLANSTVFETAYSGPLFQESLNPSMYKEDLEYIAQRRFGVFTLRFIGCPACVQIQRTLTASARRANSSNVNIIGTLCKFRNGNIVAPFTHPPPLLHTKQV